MACGHAKFWPSTARTSSSRSCRSGSWARAKGFACCHWPVNPWNCSITTCAWNDLPAAARLYSFVSKGRPAAESVTTSLGDASVTSYRGTVRHFLAYLGAQYPEVHSLDPLRRDPHILGWLALLRAHNPPLATITRANYVIYLRRMLEELAWTQQLPALAHLLGRDDVPRKEHHLPRPL